MDSDYKNKNYNSINSNNAGSKISIIVPVYNAQAYLKQTLDSILKQTYSNFELILVDDGSKDESAGICDDYREADARVKVWHNENAGPSAARNFGIRQAAGEYLAFVDSDDILSAGFLEKMMSGFEDEETDIVLCGYDRFYNDDLNDKKDYLLGEESVTRLSSNKELAMLFTVPKTSLSGVSIWAKLYKTGIIKENGIEFPLDISYEEDCCFNLLYYRKVRKAFLIKENLYHYRQSLSSLSKVYKDSTYRDLVNGYNERKKFFAELDMPETAVRKLDSVFLVVIFNNYKKIARSPGSAAFRKREYRKVLDYKETSYVVNACGLSKVRLTRYLTIASRHRWVTAISFLMWLWKIREK